MKIFRTKNPKDSIKTKSIYQAQQIFVDKSKRCCDDNCCDCPPPLPPIPGPPGKDGASCCNCFNFQDVVTSTTVTVDTGNPLDVTIVGDGYFVLRTTPYLSGSNVYTRHGHFHLDASRYVITDDGYFLLDDTNSRFQLPLGYTNLVFSSTGLVTVMVGMTLTTITQLNIAIFNNESQLQYVGNYIYLETAYSGVAVLGNPGAGGFGTLEQFFLESSTVTDQSRIYTAVSNTVVTDPGPPNVFLGNELSDTNDDGNLGVGHNVYPNVVTCSLGPTTTFIGAGFGGSINLGPTYNYGQILIRNKIPGLTCGCIQRVTVDTYLAMTGYDNTYPAQGTLVISLWNVTTSTWENQYVNALFPIQSPLTIDDPVSFQEVKLDLCINGCDYLDSDGFINFFIYTPYSGSFDAQQNPAQIDMTCFNVCTFCECTAVVPPTVVPTYDLFTQTGDIDIPNGNFTNMTFDVQNIATNWSVDNTGVFTCLTTGTYNLVATVAYWQAVIGEKRSQIQLLPSGVVIALQNSLAVAEDVSDSNGTYHTVICTSPFTAGDTFRFVLYQTNTTSTTISAGAIGGFNLSTQMFLTKIA